MLIEWLVAALMCTHHKYNILMWGAMNSLFKQILEKQMADVILYTVPALECLAKK